MMMNAIERLTQPLLRGLCASLLLVDVASAQTQSCMSEQAMQARLRDDGQVEAMRAVEVFVDPARKAEWDASTVDVGGQVMSGADAYRLLSFQADRDNLAGLENHLSKSGMSPTAMAKGVNEMIEFSELTMKSRFLQIASRNQQFFLFRRGDTGQVVTQSDGKACIAMQLQGLTVQHYSRELPPGWLAPASRLPRLIAAYRKENRFGVAAFARTRAGDAIVILAKPQFGRGDYDGPVPYYFGGVLLRETKAGAASVVADLMHARYVERHEFNFPE